MQNKGHHLLQRWATSNLHEDSVIQWNIIQVAESEGLKYQPYINAVLKKWVESDQSILNFQTFDQLDKVYQQKFNHLQKQLEVINEKLGVKNEA